MEVQPFQYGYTATKVVGITYSVCWSLEVWTFHLRRSLLVERSLPARMLSSARSLFLTALTCSTYLQCSVAEAHNRPSVGDGALGVVHAHVKREVLPQRADGDSSSDYLGMMLLVESDRPIY